MRTVSKVADYSAGTIEDLKSYDRDLTDLEIKQLYQLGPNGGMLISGIHGAQDMRPDAGGNPETLQGAARPLDGG